MPTYPPSAWERLGKALIRRRIELDPRYRNRRVFTEERRAEYRIVNAIELSRRGNYEPATLAALELAYSLPPGAIGRILDGEAPAVPGAVRAEARALEDALEDDVRREVLTAHIRTGTPVKDLRGGDVFPGDDEVSQAEAALWDKYRWLGVEGRISGIAAIRAIALGNDHREAGLSGAA